ncbi:hypothetical protein ASU33_19620 [Solirubrum puertoriconensis]|uniref:Uncharacterized protein n=1 Tax=Solirubrum puertoriconensis TaxID=1751427 RepID=A0A9X0L5U0_SOLP1|nr:hypothetical protein ASU33_19620 [Solirubrum puertoriconensis]
MFENSPLGHKTIAPDLSICQANNALARMLGLSNPAELASRCFLEGDPAHHRYEWNVLEERVWFHKTLSSTLGNCLVRPDGPPSGAGLLLSWFRRKKRS